jgi:hypothetical protein
MTHRTRNLTIRSLAAPLAFACVLVATGPVLAQTRVNQDAQALVGFKTRVDEYFALHKKLEATLPKLSNEAKPEEIDRDQRALAALVTAERKTAKPGDIFTPDVQAIIRGILERLFTGQDRRKLRESIMDENPGNIRLTVNGRYPDQVPLANMPAEVLKALPPLPDELEYRFVGDALILLDAHAHIVADFFPNVLPR